jgi:hypothetical protein
MPAFTSIPFQAEEFEPLTRCFIGLEISRPWRGIGSALFVEVGPLIQAYERTSHKKAERGLDFGYSWRVEAQRSAVFGSFSNDQKINRGIDALKEFTILDIKVTGRLPELYVQLSNDRWIHSFATTEGQPEWTIFLNDRSWLTVKRGRIVREKNYRTTK